MRNLLAACPNFDDETAKRLEDPEFDWSVDFAAQPAIEIEPPKPPMDDDEVAVQEAEYTHYLELVDILGQAEVEFYERRAQAESEQ